MSSKIFILLSIVAAGHAIPLWIVNNPVPGAYFVNGLSPNPLPEVPPAFPSVFPFNEPQYGLSLANAQSLRRSGLAVSSSLTNEDSSQAVATAENNNPGLWSSQSALSSAANNPYGSALSSAQSNGLGYGSAITTANSAPGFQSAISQSNSQYGPWNYENSFSAAQNIGAYQASVADAVQRNGNLFQRSAANAVSAPGLQTANAQAIQTGF